MPADSRFALLEAQQFPALRAAQCHGEIPLVINFRIRGNRGNLASIPSGFSSTQFPSLRLIHEACSYFLHICLTRKEIQSGRLVCPSVCVCLSVWLFLNETIKETVVGRFRRHFTSLIGQPAERSAVPCPPRYKPYRTVKS